MSENEPTVTYLELRESDSRGEAGAGLSHKAAGLILLHVLEVASHGEPRGAVTIVHDAGEHGGRYLGLAHALSAQGWAVALPDLRGHGRSEGERGHSAGIREVLRDLSDVQDHLAYRQPQALKVLVGQGLGALYCLAFACERVQEVSALVLSAPLLRPRFQPPQGARGLLGLFRKTGPTSAGAIGWTADQLTGDAREREARSADGLIHGVITARAATQAEEAARAYGPQSAQLAMPVLVLQGEADPIASEEEAGALAGPLIEKRSFAGLRHDLFHESSARDVIATVTAWLDAKLPRT